MSIESAARRDARGDFLPGIDKPAYRYTDHYYRGCYDLEWKRLEKEAELEDVRRVGEEPQTLEERVEILEQQVKQLTEALQRWMN